MRRGLPPGSVRGFVRQRDARSERLEKAGAELFVGDLLDMRDLRKALTGVQRAYHCPPFGPNALQGAALFALAAEEAKLEVVALMNAWNPHPVHPAIFQRELWAAGRLYRWMPSVDVVHLKPGLFAFPYFFGLLLSWEERCTASEQLDRSPRLRLAVRQPYSALSTCAGSSFDARRAGT